MVVVIENSIVYYMEPEMETGNLLFLLTTTLFVLCLDGKQMDI